MDEDSSNDTDVMTIDIDMPKSTYHQCSKIADERNESVTDVIRDSAARGLELDARGDDEITILRQQYGELQSQYVSVSKRYFELLDQVEQLAQRQSQGIEDGLDRLTE